MNNTPKMRRAGLVIGTVLCLAASTLMVSAFAAPMKMTPHKIVLNAVGSSEDFQAVISMALEPGAQLVDFEVQLLFNGTLVAEAVTFRYCPIDDNFLAGFDREEVLNSPVTQALADTTATATVTGWYSAVNPEVGVPFTVQFSGEDEVEICAPGNRK